MAHLKTKQFVFTHDMKFSKQLFYSIMFSFCQQTGEKCPLAPV